MYINNVVLPTTRDTYSLVKSVLLTKKDHNLHTRLTKAEIIRICSDSNNATQKDMKYSREINLIKNSPQIYGLLLTYAFCKNLRALFISQAKYDVLSFF